MNKKSLSTLILEVLKKNRKWHWGGQLEIMFPPRKGSTVSRIARMLCEEGEIENMYKKVVGVSRPCVLYRAKISK